MRALASRLSFKVRNASKNRHWAEKPDDGHIWHGLLHSARMILIRIFPVDRLFMMFHGISRNCNRDLTLGETEQSRFLN